MISNPRIRLVIADDHAVVRAGLRSFLERQGDMAVVGEAATASEVVHRVNETHPDVVVTDLRMPGEEVSQAIRVVCQGAKPPRVLVFSAFDDPADAMVAFDAGAVGYVLKQSPEGDLLTAIRRVRAGGRYVDKGIAARMVEEVGMPGSAPSTPSAPLSERETRVLELMARGHTGPQIALELGVRIGTVESYRHRIRRKLGLRSRAEVTEFVRAYGHRWQKRA